MTHRWGFDLSTSAVRLMRREAGHWHEIASEPIDGDAMDARLRTLVEQVPDPRVVDVFLPRDQILYTDLALTDPEKAVSEIEAAMEGRTPYDLTDLEIDWEIGADNTARIAAIARDTLAEAEAFADQCGLGVARFSSLAEADDFPRLPDFGLGAAGDASLDESEGIETDSAATPFATTRPDGAEPDATPDTEPAPEGPATEPDESAPVVRVEDDAPVMRVAEEPEPPLDPGPALPIAAGAPRVRTDISLPEGGGRAAASLTPPEPVDPYGKSERPASERARSLVWGFAAVMTAAIAVVVWSILPDEIETGEATIAAPTPVEEPAPVLSDVQPDATSTLDIALVAPDAIEAPAWAALVDGLSATRANADTLPPVVAQAGVSPAELPSAVVRPSDPYLGEVVLASLEPGPTENDLVFEVPVPPVTRPGSVGLPGVQGFAAGIPPASGEAPEFVIPAPPVVASTVPDLTEEEPVAPTPPETVADETITDEAIALADPTPEISEDPDTGLNSPAAAVAAGAVVADAILEEDPSPQTSEPVDLVEAGDNPTLDTPEVVAALDEDAASPVIDPVEDSPVARTETEIDAAPLPQPTEFAAALPDTRPSVRPSNFVKNIERQAFGGRTRSELAGITPPPRPASAQRVAEEERGSAPPSALAVAASPDPRARPGDIETIVAAARTARQQQQLAALETANTSNAVRAALAENEAAEAEETAEAEASNPRNSPRMAIPSSADVARQATVEDAIRLNRINLVGVYGVPADRRALVRLPSGRYVKVKIGDRIDGGTIAAISENALLYRKGGRSYELSMPQG